MALISSPLICWNYSLLNVRLLFAAPGQTKALPTVHSSTGARSKVRNQAAAAAAAWSAPKAEEAAPGILEIPDTADPRSEAHASAAAAAPGILEIPYDEDEDEQLQRALRESAEESSAKQQQRLDGDDNEDFDEEELKLAMRKSKELDEKKRMLDDWEAEQQIQVQKRRRDRHLR